VRRNSANATRGNPIDHHTVRATLDYQLEAVLRSPWTIESFGAWWDRHAVTGFLGRLTLQEDPRGRDAVDLVQTALDDHRRAWIGDPELLDRLRLALGRLRG
jgi:hypothetical protein